eukprot:gene714-8966_t
MKCKYEKYGCAIEESNEQHEASCPYLHAAENERLRALQGKKETFREELWDKFPEVITRLKTSGKSVATLINYMKAQATTLDSFGSTLSKEYLPIDYLGECTDPHHTMILFTHKVGNEYNYVSQFIQNHIIRDLNKMNDDINHMIKYSTSIEKSLHKSYESALNDCKKLKTDDIKTKTVVDGQYDELFKKKALDLKTWIKLSNQIKKTENDYKISILNQNMTHDLYFDGLDDLMSSIQDLDTRRVKLMKRVLLEYKTLMADLGKVSKERNDIMKEAFESMDPVRETKEFVLSLKTGKEREAKLKFEPYQAQIPDDVSASRFSVLATPSTNSNRTSANNLNALDSPVSEPKEDSGKVEEAEDSELAPMETPETVLKVMKALYDYEPTNDTEIPLKEGAEVKVYQMADDWWVGECQGAKGKVAKFMMINDSILGLILFGTVVIRLFFDKLRVGEEEKVFENTYVTIIESCLALTIFRGVTNMYVLALFLITLFLKIFHWICKMRVQHLESLPETSNGTFFKYFFFISGLIFWDAILTIYFFTSLLNEGASVKLFFLSEFIILLITSIACFTRLFFHLVHSSSNWDSKDVYNYYLDIVSDLSQSLVYITFFIILFAIYGLPIHLIRDIYRTVQSSIKRIKDFINYQKMVHHLNTKIPNAEPEELVDQDCVICWAPMETAKKLPCGHLFHGVPCLRNWLEESTFCPLCKAPINQDEYELYLAERSQTNTPIVRPIDPTTREMNQFQNENIQERINEIYQNVFQQYGISVNQENDTIQINPQEEEQFENSYENKNEEIKNENQVDSQEDSFLHNNIEIIKLDAEIERMNPSSKVDKIMADMYIKHLQNYKKLMDETIEKLKVIRDEQHS